MSPVKWFPVSRKRPCLICGKVDWCTWSEIGSGCMRVASDRPMKNGGYLHKSVNDDSVRQSLMLPMPAPKPSIDPGAMMKRWAAQTTETDRNDYARKLGVDAYAIELLGAAYTPQHGAWAWPMRDAAGDICGIRLRSDDRKWAVTGSKSGLFIPQTSISTGIDAMVCEGPTDTAAALTLGYFAVGRSSCMGGVDLVRDTMERMGVRRVIIMSDNDEAKLKPDGSRWYPGQEGARQLAMELKMPSIIIQPGAKDIRAWVRSGVSRDEVDFLIKQKMFRKG